MGKRRMANGRKSRELEEEGRRSEGGKGREGIGEKGLQEEEGCGGREGGV